jgi:hypothetical protein
MRSRLILAALAGLALAACQTAPEAEPVIRLAQAAETAPVAVAVPVSENLTEGLTENDWGGEVPQSKPAGDVSEGGLGDIE